MSKRFRLFQAALGLTAAVFFVMGLQAIEPNTPQTKGGKTQLNKEELAAKEKILETKYRQFEEQLLLLKQRLEKSADKKDQERAAQLAKVLDKSSDFSITTRFAEMVKLLSSQKLSKIADVNTIMAASGKLAEGAFTASALVEMAAAHGIEMPIASAVAAVLAQRLSVDEAVESLLARPFRSEGA